MPFKAPRICGVCRQTITQGFSCECRKQRRREDDRRRPSPRDRGYGDRWRRARLEFLALYPFCTVCGSAATVVDHKIPHRGDQRLFWDRTNWQSLCAPHHNSMKQRMERTCA